MMYLLTATESVCKLDQKVSFMYTVFVTIYASSYPCGEETSGAFLKKITSDHKNVCYI